MMDKIPKALLIIAHGSRRADANRYLEKLPAELEADIKDRFLKVACAYLQFNGPYAWDTISELVQEGVRHIVIFPFFLSAGGHVTSDIPELIQQAEAQFPDVVFETITFLGGLKGLKDLILEAVPPG